MQQYYGIIRQMSGGDDRPHVKTFLELNRMMSCYYSTRSLLKGNVDNVFRIEVLTSFGDVLKRLADRNQRIRDDKRQHLEDILLNGLAFEMAGEADPVDEAIAKQSDKDLGDADKENQSGWTQQNANVAYYVSAYILYSLRHQKNCDNCMLTVQCDVDHLPKDFDAAQLTIIKNRGFLKFGTTDYFRMILEVEKIFLQCVAEKKIFIRDAFETILCQICSVTLPAVGCNVHRIDFVKDLIFKYLLTRFRCIAKRKSVDLTTASKTKALSHAKIAKIGQTPVPAT